MMETTANLYRLGGMSATAAIFLLINRRRDLAFHRSAKRLAEIPMIFDATALAGKYFIVTGSGKYFKNVAAHPAENLGVIRVKEDGQTLNCFGAWKMVRCQRVNCQVIS